MNKKSLFQQLVAPPATTGRSCKAAMHSVSATGAKACVFAILFLFLLPFGAGAQGVWDYEKEMAEDAAMLVRLGLIQSAGEKPGDYRTDANPMAGKYTNLATVPELFLYWSNTGKQTYREYYDNVNKTLSLLEDKKSASQTIDGSAARIVKAMPLNVDKNATAAQEYTAELMTVSNTEFKVSIRNKTGTVNSGSYTHTFNVGDWSFMQSVEKEQLFDYYFQIVSGDFNGDGCDDIAYFMPQLFNYSGGTSTAVRIVFLQKDGNAIKQLGSVLDLGYITNGVGAPYEAKPTVHLSVTNLNKDSSDDLAVVRGWTRPANSPGGKDGPSILFIYDQLKSGSTNAFTAKLEETGNTFTDVTLNSQYPDMADCDITQAHTTGLMAVTTATGNVVSPDNAALVIAGYTIVKKSDGKYSDRYIGFYNKKYPSFGTMYVPFIGIAVLTYDFNNKTYKFRDKDGYNTDDFAYQLTEGTVSSRFVSYNMPAPIAMTTAKLAGAANRANVVIDGTVYLLKDKEFVTETGATRASYDMLDMAHLFGATNDAYNNNPIIYQSPMLGMAGVPKNNTWIQQSVAANTTGNALGQAHVYSIMNKPLISYIIEYYGDKVDDSSTLGFLPQKPFLKNLYPYSLTGGIGSWLCLQDMDAGDGVVAEFLGRAFVYTKPKVLAVMAAPPYFADLADASDDDSYTGEGETSISTYVTEGDEHSVSTGLYLEGFVTAGTDWPIGSVEAKAGLFGSLDYTFTAGWTQTITVTRTNDTPYDQALLIATPMDILYYNVKGIENGKVSEHPLIMTSQYAPREVMMPVSQYDAIASQSSDLPVIGGNILKHTAGDPKSYMNWSLPATGGIITKAKLPDSHHTMTEWAGAQSNTTLTIDVSKDDSHTISAEVGYFFEFTAKVVVGGGFRVEQYAGYGFTHFNSKGSAFTGHVNPISPATAGAEAAGFAFNWSTRNFVVETKNANGEKMEFPVLTYETKDINRLLETPTDLAVDEAATTTTDIALTWVPNTNAGKQKLQYRQKGNTSWTTVDDNILSSDAAYTHSGRTEGTIYEYRLCAIGSDSRESLYTPVCTAQTQVSSMPSFTTDVADLSKKDGEKATFSVVVERGRNGQLDYQWQELLNNVWTDIKNNNKDFYEIAAVTKYDNGRKFRCIVTETLTNIPAVITSAPGELKILKENAAVTLAVSPASGNITWKATTGDEVTLTATVTSSTASTGDRSGTVVFVIGLPGDTVNVRLTADATTGNSYTATAKFTATAAGVHTITAVYNGNIDYSSATSAEETYTASYPAGTKMIVLTDSLGKDHFEQATLRAVYGESVAYTVSIAEILSDGSMSRTALGSSDLTFDGTAYFSMEDEGSDIKFSCTAAGTFAATLEYDNGTAYTFDLNLEAGQRPVPVTVDNQEIFIGDPFPTLTYTAEATQDGRGFLPGDESEFSAANLECPAFVNSDARGTYPVTLGTLPSGTLDNYDLQITPATVRVKGEEVTVNFGVAGSSDALLIGKVYNGTDYEMQLTPGGKAEKGLTLKFGLEVYDPDKQVAYWVEDNAIVPGTEGLFEHSVTGYTDDVSVIAFLDDSRYTVTYSASTAAGSIAGYYAGTMPFTSGTDLFAGTDLKFVATPGAGFVVKEWNVDGITVAGNTSNELLITGLNKITTVEVVFEPVTACAVTFGVREGSGAVTATADGTPLTNGEYVDKGATVVFAVQPDPGQIFRRWWINGVSGPQSTPYTETVTADLNVEAAFTSASGQKYTVTYSAEQFSGLNVGTVSAMSGTTTVYSLQNVDEGSNLVFTAAVKPAYLATHKFSHWDVDGTVVPDDGTGACTHYLNAAVTVKAVFAEIATVVSVTPSGTAAPVSGGISITFSSLMDILTPGTIELNSLPVPAAGVWSDNDKTYTVAYDGLATGTAYTVNISGFRDVDGYAVVADNTHGFTTAATVTYGVSILTTNGGTVTPDQAAYAEDATVTLTVSLTTGYMTDAISACKTGEPSTSVALTPETNGTYTFRMPAYGVTVTAAFSNPDKESVDEAKTLIEGVSDWTVAMTTANTEADVKLWLAQQINALPGMSATGIAAVTENDITITGSFTAAIAGMFGAPSGTAGAFTFTVALSKNAATATSNGSGTITATAFVLVNAAMPTIVTHPQDRSVMQGGSVSLSVQADASDGGSLSYRWYRSASNSNSGGTVISGETSASYSPPTAATGTYYYYVVVTNTNNNANGLTTAEAASNAAVVTVTSSTPAVNAETPSITSHPQSLTTDVGSSVTLSVTAQVSDGGSLSYQWYRSTGTAISGATGSSYSPSTASTGTSSYYVVVTNTNNNVNGSTTARATSNTATVTVTTATFAITVAPAANGMVTANSTSAAAGETVTLTIAPATGYELNTIMAYSTSSPPTSVTLSGTGSVRTFAMPAYSVTVTATFQKTQAQADRDAVDAAKAAIEGGTYRIAQTTGNDTPGIDAWLTNTLNALFGASHGIQLRSTAVPVTGDVAIASVIPAVAGTETTPGGTDGWFTFSVTLTRGAATVTTGIVPGVIVATPHATTPVKRIELHYAGTLQVRVANTGNIHSGEHAFTLTGGHADKFTLLTDGQTGSSHPGLNPGEEHYVTLVPVSGLSAGIYSVRLTVTAADMTPVSLDINHQYIPTANDDIPQTKPLKAWAQNERLHVSGLTTGETWSVYSVTGMLIYHGIAAGDEADLPLSDRGVYIVKSGVQIIKVLY